MRNNAGGSQCVGSKRGAVDVSTDIKQWSSGGVSDTDRDGNQYRGRGPALNTFSFGCWLETEMYLSYLSVSPHTL